MIPRRTPTDSDALKIARNEISSLEKYLSRFLITSIGYLIAGTVIYMLLSPPPPRPSLSPMVLSVSCLHVCDNGISVYICVSLTCVCYFQSQSRELSLTASKQ